MNWAKFFGVFLRNVLLVTVLSGLFLALLGYLFAGEQGFANGATWGVILGIASAPFSAFAIISAKYWGDFSGRLGAWWVKRETEGDEEEKYR